MMVLVGPILFTRLSRWLSVSLRLVALAWVIAAGFALHSSSPSDSPLLQRRIATLDFRGTPLEEALTQLGNAVGAKIILDRKALAAAGVDLAAPIDLRLRDVELGAAFDHLNFAHSEPCVMEVRGKDLYVTTEATMPAVIRVYDVSDLYDRWISSRYWAPETSWPASVQGKLSPPPEQFMDQLMDALSAPSLPHDWGSGSVEMMDSVGKQIIFNGPPSRHRRIEQLLRRMREVDAEQPADARAAPAVK
jgi:hypothetical protein